MTEMNHKQTNQDQIAQVKAFLLALQDNICAGLQAEDAGKKDG